jgi:hypothetical protein
MKSYVTFSLRCTVISKSLIILVTPLFLCKTASGQRHNDLHNVLSACFSHEATANIFFKGGRNAFVYDSKYFQKHWHEIDSFSRVDLSTRILSVKYGDVILFPLADLAYQSVNSIDKAYSTVEDIQISNDAALIRFRITTLSKRKIDSFDYLKIDFHLSRNGNTWQVEKMAEKTTSFKRLNYWR